MDWVWRAALIWIVLVLPLGLLTGMYLRRLGPSMLRRDPARRPRRPRSEALWFSTPVRGVAGNRPGAAPRLHHPDVLLSPRRSSDPPDDEGAGADRPSGRKRRGRAWPPARRTGH